MKNPRAAIPIIAMALMVFPAQQTRSQIIINEIIQNPEFVGDNEGEWFELFNVGPVDVDIDGWTILDAGTNNHTINNGEPLTIPSMGYLVLGRSTDTMINGNTPVAYSYGTSFTLGNGSDQIILLDRDAVEVDRVEYDGGGTFPDPSGASMELISPSLDNNVGGHWAEATSSWAGNDLGTPGSLNSVTDVLPPFILSASIASPTTIEVLFNEAVDQLSSEMPTNYVISNGIGNPLLAERDTLNQALVHLAVSSLGGGTYTLTASGITDLVGNLMLPVTIDIFFPGIPSQGDIIVCEIMQDPDVISDSDGEWFEVYNTTDAPVDMNGWRISDNGSNAFTVSGSFVVPPHEFALFVVNPDSAVNGGFTFDTAYDWGSSSTFTLGNTDDEIIIRSGTTTIDSIAYDGGPLWPDTTGGSIGLVDFTLDNNAGENWTIASQREPSYAGSVGNLGSPGTFGTNQHPGTSALIDISPDTVMYILEIGESDTMELTITNSGEEELVWAVGESQRGENCPWLAVDPVSGVTLPGETSHVELAANTEGFPAGHYECTLTTTSNDPGTPMVNTPVILEIVESALIGSVEIPLDLLPIPPSGDTVIMNIHLLNISPKTRQAEVWINLVVPGDSTERVVLGPRHLTFGGFDSLYHERSLRIPAKGPAGQYELRLNIGGFPGIVDFSSAFLFEKSPDARKRASTIDPGTAIPASSFLAGNYPNPFNPRTEIRYGLSEDAWVKLKVYDILGREIITLVDEFQHAGHKSVEWRGEDLLGGKLGSGIYFYHIQAGTFSKMARMVFLK